MEACKRFLKQLNTEDVVLHDVTELTMDGLKKKLNECADAKEGYMAICWNNTLSLHAFCKGLCDVEAATDITDEAVNSLLLQMFPDRKVRWFYPYPSLENTTHIFSDNRLPQKMECEDNYDNFDKAMLESFDERWAAGMLVQAGRYSQMANAYMVIVGDAKIDQLSDYCRFSTQRREEKQIMTCLSKKGVSKCAYTSKANAHIEKLITYEKELSELLAGSTVCGKELSVNAILSNQADETEAVVMFVFEEGKSLEEILDEKVRGGIQGQKETEEILLSVCKLLREKATGDFERTQLFTDIFGEQEDSFTQCKTLPVTDIDFVCQNLLVDDKKVVLIDYEWTFDVPIPVEYAIYRFLYLYLEAKDRTVFAKEKCDEIYTKAGISLERRNIWERMETSFQQYVQMGAAVLRNEHELHGKPVLKKNYLDQLLNQLDQKNLSVTCLEQAQEALGRQIEKKILYPSADGNILHYQIACDRADQLQITMQGYEMGALLRLGMVYANSNQEVIYETNGKIVGGLIYQFENQPMLTIKLPEKLQQEKEAILLLSIEEIQASKDATRELLQRIADLEFLVDNREQQLEQMRQSASWKVTAPLRKLKGTE